MAPHSVVVGILVSMGVVLGSVVGIPFVGALFLWAFAKLFRFARASYKAALQTLLIAGCGALAGGAVAYAPALDRAQDVVTAGLLTLLASAAVGFLVAVVASAKILGGTVWKAIGAVSLSLLSSLVLFGAVLWAAPAVATGEAPESPIEFVRTLWGLAFGGPIPYQVTVVHVVPLGAVPERDVETVRRIIEQAFPALTVSVIGRLDLPAGALDRQRHQYDAAVLCDKMAGLTEHSSIRTIGVTDADLFSAGLNYVFSCARPRGLGGVMSVYRLRDPDNADLTRARYRKIALRALGIMWGFRTSSDRQCIMAYSNSLEDLDAKGTEWCGREPADIRRIVK